MKSKILIIPFLFLIMTTKGGVEDTKPVQICWIAGHNDHNNIYYKLDNYDNIYHKLDYNTNNLIGNVIIKNNDTNKKSFDDITNISGFSI